MVVLVVVLEVLGQVADALGEDRDLDFEPVSPLDWALLAMTSASSRR
jgi:hypothetical protein